MPEETSTTNQPAQAPAPGSEELLRETLKRCSPRTIEAALEFRRTSDVSLVSVVALGIVERFLDPDVAEKLRSGDDSLRFMEDLGMDSLTMIEAIMMVEESLGVSIKNEELIDLRSVGDLKQFIHAKVSGVEPQEKSTFLAVEHIAAVMPQQDPFLFLEEATVFENRATGRYTISGKEFFLKGHFKDNPVFPASILLETLGQLAVLHLIKSGKLEGDAASAIYFTGADGVRCHRVCKPGDTLELSVEVKRERPPMIMYAGRIHVSGEKAVSVEEITLINAPSAAEDSD